MTFTPPPPLPPPPCITSIRACRQEHFLYMLWFNLFWFKFYFPLFLGMVMYDNEFKTRKIQFKPRIKLNQHSHIIQGNTCILRVSYGYTVHVGILLHGIIKSFSFPTNFVTVNNGNFNYMAGSLSRQDEVNPVF